jgi:hypothetical protein
VRTTIESGVSAPGGKLWHMHDYLRLASHHFNKRRRDRREQVA